DDPGEVSRAVAGPVVGDDPVDVGDAVRCEPDLGSGQERSSGGPLLVGQRLGVGESRESVDGRMRVGVAALRASRLGALDGLGLVALAAMGTPAAAIGDPADLLPVQVHHVTGPVCIDLPGLAVALSAWVDEPPSAETELGQVAGDGAAVDRESELDEFVGDSIGRPFVFTPPGLDALEDPGGCRART